MLNVTKSQLSAGLFAMTALVLGTATAQAATAGDSPIAQILNTSPVWADTASYHACNVVNVTTTAINVSIALINSAGVVIIQTSAPESVAAGASFEFSNGGGYTGFARCRFTLNFSADSIRANITAFHTLSSSTYQTYAISEAR
jgi:hypothetical protein